MRNCILCTYWFISFEEDYSELTPGAGFESGCLKHHWHTDPYDISKRNYRKYMKTAEKCNDFLEENNA